MKNKETGEFELVVGNGQIISGFFILALLLAVFFAMGFIVARAKYQQEPATTTASATQADTRQQTAAQAPVPLPSSDQPPADVKGAGAGEDAGRAPAEGAQVAPPEKPVEAAPQPAAAGDAGQGSYWQVTSTKDPSAARAMLQSMKDMGLPASLSPGPNDFTRVLVGPYSDTATMAKVKTQLENAGLHPVKHTQ